MQAKSRIIDFSHFILRKTLHALQFKAFTPRTADSTHGLRCAPNRLLDQPKPTQANQVRVSDITYLPLANGAWAYLCAFQDMASKQVVGWQVGTTMPQELVIMAVQQAFLVPCTLVLFTKMVARSASYCAAGFTGCTSGAGR